MGGLREFEYRQVLARLLLACCNCAQVEGIRLLQCVGQHILMFIVAEKIIYDHLLRSFNKWLRDGRRRTILLLELNYHRRARTDCNKLCAAEAEGLFTAIQWQLEELLVAACALAERLPST